MAEHNHEHEHNHEEHEHITLVDENGNESLFEILMTFDSDDYGKSYVIVYPAGIPDDVEVELQAYAYTQGADGVDGELMPIESDEEWDMVEEVLGTFLADEDEE